MKQIIQDFIILFIRNIKKNYLYETYPDKSSSITWLQEGRRGSIKLNCDQGVATVHLELEVWFFLIVGVNQ